MIAKFTPKPKESTRLKHPIVGCRLKPENLDEFYAICLKTGLSPATLAGQMIAFAINNMRE